MTSCPAGSVSSSLDSLEKLFSLQLSGKKKSFGFFCSFECIIITIMCFVFFPFLLAPGPVSTSQTPPLIHYYIKFDKKSYALKYVLISFFTYTITIMSWP